MTVDWMSVDKMVVKIIVDEMSVDLKTTYEMSIDWMSVYEMKCKPDDCR